MRGGLRRAPQHEEDESAFVSMTDMTVSFLFIVILLLAFFASNFAAQEERIAKSLYDQKVQELKDERAKNVKLNETIEAQKERIEVQESTISDLRDRLKVANETIEKLRERIAELEAQQSDELEIYQAKAAEIRQRLLERIRDSVEKDFDGLQAKVSDEGDALRLQGEGLFESGSPTLRPDKLPIIAAIAENLSNELPCYTLGPSASWSEKCNAAAVVIEAVQIEGHADGEGEDIPNLELSSDRAIETFKKMLNTEPNLLQHLNPRDQPVLSVSGYGEMRPAVPETDGLPNPNNRRIDLRIIMHTPATAEDIEKIRQRLLKGEE